MAGEVDPQLLDPRMKSNQRDLHLVRLCSECLGSHVWLFNLENLAVIICNPKPFLKKDYSFEANHLISTENIPQLAQYLQQR